MLVSPLIFCIGIFCIGKTIAMLNPIGSGPHWFLFYKFYWRARRLSNSVCKSRRLSRTAMIKTFVIDPVNDTPWRADELPVLRDAGMQ